MVKRLLTLILLIISNQIISQPFYFGSDMSYVNEMEDCGVIYHEDQTQNDPYSIFANHGCNLVRLRLWHTPKWYDNLNNGNRYSDLADVKIAIARAKAQNLDVLLDFHLSDNWADPSKQLVPEAWLPVVDNTDILKDSLYNYIFETLTELDNEDLLPELIQIGNETNKGILLSPADNQVWTLDWPRNAALFNHAIKAVEDFEQLSEKDIKIALHIAGPGNADWLIDGFISNGVTNFDVIGISYYWAWHMPTSIAVTGEIIETLKSLYPDKEVMIFETGYIWTNSWNDNANNIMTQTHPDYAPASPENQRDWLIHLTQEVIASGGKGVIYWEPCWVSSPCFTQWGQGSHQENATFFDFDNNLLLPGGIEWMSYDYGLISETKEIDAPLPLQILVNGFSGEITIEQRGALPKLIHYSVMDIFGQILLLGSTGDFETAVELSRVPHGIYIISVYGDEIPLQAKKFVYSSNY